MVSIVSSNSHERTGHSIQLADNNRVTLSELVDHSKKLPAFALCTGYFLLKDSLDGRISNVAHIRTQVSRFG
jgi:hypothetical protein